MLFIKFLQLPYKELSLSYSRANALSNTSNLVQFDQDFKLLHRTIFNGYHYIEDN